MKKVVKKIYTGKNGNPILCLEGILCNTMTVNAGEDVDKIVHDFPFKREKDYATSDGRVTIYASRGEKEGTIQIFIDTSLMEFIDLFPVIRHVLNVDANLGNLMFAEALGRAEFADALAAYIQRLIDTVSNGLLSAKNDDKSNPPALEE